MPRKSTRSIKRVKSLACFVSIFIYATWRAEAILRKYQLLDANDNFMTGMIYVKVANTGFVFHR